VPAGVFLRPDASIYSQRYLMSLGAAVTWDNPDVHLTDLAGNTVASHDLAPGTDYRIEATIHNKSNGAPAPGLPVRFTLLGFGIGGPAEQFIGADTIDLPVRGAVGEPAVASVVWTTPVAQGHYCIEIEAIWADDANPLDNLGQHNTVVREVEAGALVDLTLPVRHDRQGTRLLTAHVHGYQVPTQPLLRDIATGRSETQEVVGDHAQAVLAANAEALFPLPADWSVELSHPRLELDAGADAVPVSLRIGVPPTASPGLEQPITLVFVDAEVGNPIGGVTVLCRVPR
jgi:hypothetical protein